MVIFGHDMVTIRYTITRVKKIRHSHRRVKNFDIVGSCVGEAAASVLLGVELGSGSGSGLWFGLGLGLGLDNLLAFSLEVSRGSKKPHSA